MYTTAGWVKWEGGCIMVNDVDQGSVLALLVAVRIFSLLLISRCLPLFSFVLRP